MKSLLLAAVAFGGSCWLAAAAPAADGSDWDAASAAPSSGGSNSSFSASLAKLDWTRGPKRIDLFHRASLELKAGYVYLEPSETQKFMTLTHNLSDDSSYLLAPEDMHWFALIHFSDDGYVKDDEKIDADAILASIKKNTEAANATRREKGWQEMTVVGWQTPPYYEMDTKRLDWAVIGRAGNGTSAVNFNTRILGLNGVTSAVLVADHKQLDAAIGEFRDTLKTFDYSIGQRYAEYRPGDKIAKYGLAALVTGGAAAIAVKTGLWKVIVGFIAAGWKFIVAALVALFGGIGKFFKRKTR